MGGFHLFRHGSKETSHNATNIFVFHELEDDAPLHPLSYRDLYSNKIDFSSLTVPTEVEIKDREKSDWLAKSLVLLQTSWFVMQCIARAIEHLPITHLEIVTLAYAVVNFVIYIFWWNKPLNVNRPIRVFRKSEPQRSVNEPILEARELTWKAIGKGLEMIFQYIAGAQDDFVDLSREDRVPRFWADNNSEDVVIADFIVLGVGVCFGAIHCIAWDFSFPTHTELLIWRISSVAITAVPMFIFGGFFLAFWVNDTDFGIADAISTFPPGILYIIARTVTLVLAFTSLRDLPHGAFDTVHWTTFIPHV